MKIKYKIGTDSKGNYKVRFAYKYDSGVVVQETHHLPYAASAENTGKICQYTNVYMHILRSKFRQNTADKDNKTEALQHGEKGTRHDNFRNRRPVQNERKVEAHRQN